MTLIHTTRLNELLEMSKGLYLTVIGLTESPAEAVNIICMMHLSLWLNHNNGEHDVDTMLKQYCDNFKENLEENQKLHRKEMN